MNGLILCRTKEAVNPYYISGMDTVSYTHLRAHET